MSKNIVILEGRVGRDAEVRFTAGGRAVANFTMATSEEWYKDGKKQERTEWHKIVVWDKKLAEVCGERVRKGDSVAVVGRIQSREWTDKDGKKHTVTEIKADSMPGLDEPAGKEVEESPPANPDDDSQIPF